MEAVLLYITAAKHEDAVLLVRELLGERLIACANIMEHVTSLYWWQGAIDQETEVVIVAKTMAEHVSKVIDRVKALHTYDCPCVIALPIKDGNPDYIAWIAKETSSA